MVDMKRGKRRTTRCSGISGMSREIYTKGVLSWWKTQRRWQSCGKAGVCTMMGNKSIYSSEKRVEKGPNAMGSVRAKLRYVFDMSSCLCWKKNLRTRLNDPYALCSSLKPAGSLWCGRKEKGNNMQWWAQCCTSIHLRYSKRAKSRCFAMEA